MSSEESDYAWTDGVGPRLRKPKKLHWERSKLRNIKAVLDRNYTSSVKERQKRTKGAIPEMEKNQHEQLQEKALAGPCIETFANEF